MSNVTLRQLRYFDALARHGHFGRAAEVCAVSQPALSVQIKALEDTLGLTLVERGARSLRLTPFGHDCADRAAAILQSVDELSDLARAAQDGLTGRLRIGIIPTIAPYLLPALIGRVSRDHASLDVHVRETITPKLIHELHGGRLDAAILALPVSEPGLTEIPLFDEAFVLVRPLPDANRPVPDRDALREMRLLLLEEGHCFRDQALSFCALKTALPRDALEGSSLATLVQMVGAGIGVTLIPEMAVPVETRSAEVAIARFADPQPRRHVGMVWRHSHPLADRFHDLAQVVQDTAHHLRAQHIAKTGA